MTEWPYYKRPDDARFVPDRIPEPARTEIEDAIWAWLITGENDPEDFVDFFDDEDERHGLSDEELTAACERALDVRRAQQRSFGDVRSNLARAFDDLNQAGVLARANFSCCGTCASAEIHDERDDSRHWHGYVWFHQQDTESLIASSDGSVYLGYGVYPPADFDEAAYHARSEAEQQAGYQADLEHLLDDTVFPILRRHGIEPAWNRKQSTRILLTGAQWYAPVG